ncbi:predicted lipase [Chthonomonas calidirosea]|uniref:lipase family protein n=1 Tax=Chthonomonas calidirosea TaxID=454171 RepID=UPI0006DD4744|nr:lipase family protein [Chthonomonas calidirosea]CEK14378.1 predicted lipase [Chthonomonas calidirosea]
MTNINLREAILAGLLTREAEAMTSTDGFNGRKLTINNVTFSVIATIYAKELSTDLMQRQNYVPFGFIACSDSHVVIAFRGTETIWEWIHDAEFLTTPYGFVSNAEETDDGFTNVYASLCTNPTAPSQRLVDSIPSLLGDRVSDTSIIVCGHSLGAAVASLFALDAVGNSVLPACTVVYTFATPYVGNSQFAKTYDAKVPNTFRIVNRLDIVTHLPPRAAFNYSLIGQPYVLTPKDVRVDISCQHHLTTYLHLLSLQVASPTGNAIIPLDPACRLRSPIWQCCMLCLLKAPRG